MNIEEIKERHSKIGGTPWKASEYSTDYYTQGYRVKTWNNGEIASCIEEKGEVDFIANAPNDIAYLLSIIEQAEKALKSAQADISSLTLAFEEETTSNTTIEEVIKDGRMSKSWIEIIEALQAIRKGD